MKDSASATKTISLKSYGIDHDNINYQLSPEELHQITIEKGMGREASSGALAVNTGEFTGRSPMDRFIVKDEITSEKVWWGKINIPFESDKFDALYENNKKLNNFTNYQKNNFILFLLQHYN